MPKIPKEIKAELKEIAKNTKTGDVLQEEGASIVEGAQDDIYKNTDICMHCGKLKNNISPASAGCKECDDKDIETAEQLETELELEDPELQELIDESDSYKKLKSPNSIIIIKNKSYRIIAKIIKSEDTISIQTLQKIEGLLFPNDDTMELSEEDKEELKWKGGKKRKR